MGKVIPFASPRDCNRPPYPDDAVIVLIPVDLETLARIDHAAMWAMVDRTELLRRFVASGYGAPA